MAKSLFLSRGTVAKSGLPPSLPSPPSIFSHLKARATRATARAAAATTFFLSFPVPSNPKCHRHRGPGIREGGETFSSSSSSSFSCPQISPCARGEGKEKGRGFSPSSLPSSFALSLHNVEERRRRRKCMIRQNKGKNIEGGEGREGG